MSKNKSRTYARNRTNLSRRGNVKFIDSDGIFFLKLIFFIILSTFWVKFRTPVGARNAVFNGVPMGMIIALILNKYFEKKLVNRQLWYAVIVVVTIISYFLPAGIVI